MSPSLSPFHCLFLFLFLLGLCARGWLGPQTTLFTYWFTHPSHVANWDCDWSPPFWKEGFQVVFIPDFERYLISLEWWQRNKRHTLLSSRRGERRGANTYAFFSLFFFSGVHAMQSFERDFFFPLCVIFCAYCARLALRSNGSPIFPLLTQNYAIRSFFGSRHMTLAP